MVGVERRDGVLQLTRHLVYEPYSQQSLISGCQVGCQVYRSCFIRNWLWCVRGERCVRQPGTRFQTVAHKE
eukprot:10183158-Prorocentrum_lima.AAC.1